MTEKRFEKYRSWEEKDYVFDNQRWQFPNTALMDIDDCIEKLNAFHEENNQLKSDLAIIIEQARENDEFLRSDIRILQKALWCSSCGNNFKRLKELRKEFLK